MVNKEFLVIGHPRTGTGYTSKLLQMWGFDVGHEVMGKDGIAAWQWCLPVMPFIKVKKEDYSFNTVIHCVRNPKTAIPSIVWTEEASVKYRGKILTGIKYNNHIELAIISLLKFDEIISSTYEDRISFRIEDQKEYLYNRLVKIGNKLGLESSEPPKNYNTRKKWYDGKIINWNEVCDDYKNKLNKYCKKYGYKEINYD